IFEYVNEDEKCIRCEDDAGIIEFLPQNEPSNSSSVEKRERLIKAKCLENGFIAELPPSSLSLSARILVSVNNDDPIECLRLLAHTSPSNVNEAHPEHN
uniref:Uncharacterized protein n=1 Tax=Amphimedon queenslandica TaxID=400682 RepID=A0A1X7SV72_AMPQE